MLYLSMFTDYGFNLSATRDVSVHRSDSIKLSQLFNSVLATKLLLCLTSLIILTVALKLIPNFASERTLYYLSFPMVLGQVIFPVWFFQGVEQMKYITFFGTVAKVISTLLIFIFIKSPADYIYVNIFHGLGGLLTGFCALFIVRRNFNISWQPVSIEAVKTNLQEGWHIFIASFTTVVSINSNLFILGLFAKPIEIGYYSVAEKVYQVFRSVSSIIYQSIYPKVCVLAQESFSRLVDFLTKTTKLIIVFMLPASLIVFLSSEYVVYVITGQYNAYSALLLRILCFGPLIAALNIPACQTMLAYNMRQKYALIMSISGAFNVILNVVLCKFFLGIGTAIAAITTECFITLLLYAFLEANKPEYSVIQIFNFLGFSSKK